MPYKFYTTREWCESGYCLCQNTHYEYFPFVENYSFWGKKQVTLARSLVYVKTLSKLISLEGWKPFSRTFFYSLGCTKNRNLALKGQDIPESEMIESRKRWNGFQWNKKCFIIQKVINFLTTDPFPWMWEVPHFLM